ncbi:mCG1031467, partial [Mus musculus]
ELSWLGLIFLHKHHDQETSWELVMVAHAFNPSTREAEAGRFLSSSPAWSTK